MDTSWLTIISGSALLLSVMLLSLMLFLKVRPRRFEDRRDSNATILMQARRAGRVARSRQAATQKQCDTAQSQRMAGGLGRRMVQLETQFRLLAERQDQFDLSQPSSAPYRTAIRLAERGASVQEISTTCKLSASEAQLINTLHRPPQPSRQRLH
ncbi:MAG TPA: DUF2802 domain-containing protein [Acidiferrobacteraceae bacterium]|nr:DUF2802 domain-containing protein [Acidiferrobacteraceae bacterium]